MEGLTDSQKTGYNLIELRILFQRAIEVMDDLKIIEYPLRNKQLHALLKGLIGPLDKETRKYNAMFDVCEEGTSVFYHTVKDSCSWIMEKHLFDKALFAQYQRAHDLDHKAVEGIINKVIKRGQKC